MFDYLKKNIVTILLFLLNAIIFWLIGQFNSSVLPLIKNWNSEILIWPLIGFFLLFLIAIFIVIYYYGQLHPKNLFKTAFGIYWDKDKNPICPIDKIPLSHYYQFIRDNQLISGYSCPICKSDYYLRDKVGNNIELKDAINKL